MLPDYSSAAGAHSPSVRRILFICAFICASATALAYHQQAGDGTGAPVAATAAPAALPAPAEFAGGDFDALARAAVDKALWVPPPSNWTTVAVKRGENLATIFSQLSLPSDDVASIVGLGGSTSALKHLKTGDQLRLRVQDGELKELVYPLDESHALSVRRGSRGFETATLSAAVERRRTEATGVIENSLFLDGRHAGMSDRMILEFADLFGYDIDFAQDLQEGDRFSVVYETLYKDGKKVRDGDILAAEFVNQGHSYRAVRFVAADGSKGYYTPQGMSLRKAFIRTPVDFTYISSGFTLHRWHPILHRMRAHTGTDYAAPTGTPVHAAGNGSVEFIGRRGGYGNLLVIRHNGAYETYYGHLSRFQPGLRAGSRVQQGQVVAYVGMTGLATGPHLHYEFRVNGLPVNPEKVTLPRALPLPPQALAHFRAETAPLVAALDTASSHQVAQATSVER
ncbi:MAG: peptidoglycan DD-metalloendopeptidase family protein [Nevskia sp.]|nr:peptidoglycan DD-metalloendopeptidase family protein [Nevskia sp.]